ncbi:MAG TPA: hypothetical protein VII33_17315 [Nakamurella sp.]
MFPIVGDASIQPDRLPDLSPFDVLVEDKVWQHLGLTLEEFLAQEAEGAYAGDRRPEVVALMNLMCTGAWQVAGRTARHVSGTTLSVIPSARQSPRLVAGVALTA